MSKASHVSQDLDLVGLEIPPLSESGFEELKERRSPGLPRRLLTTLRHLGGLALGALVDEVRRRPKSRRRGWRFRLAQVAAVAARPLIKSSLREASFPVQLRRRLEMLGPTYIKLGQVLSLRVDLLPKATTEELKHLLDRLPAVPFERFLELVSDDLERPIDELFAWIDPRPLGSASIAQIHRATTRDGDEVILKAVKPGIRATLEQDGRLLRLLVSLLQPLFPRYQPKRVFEEFHRYTLEEVDLRREADNAEIFAAYFEDEPDIVFPRIFRDHSGGRVLCMEYLAGLRPDSVRAQELTEGEKERLVDLGAAAIIRMIYRDGFFHADLHPGNLVLMRGGPKAGFIDLGMVGRLDEDHRRTLLYYYTCLVTGDPENAARYLSTLAEPGPAGDRQGFRREVAEIGRRWRRGSSFEEFSLGQLILESIAAGARYDVYFPVEMVLMVKALVTFEAVGQSLRPGFDVAAVSKPHVSQVFMRQLSPLRLMRDSLQSAPELLDAVVKAPLLVTEGLRLLEKTARRPARNPLAGGRGPLFGGVCLLAGAIIAAGEGRDQLWPVAVALFVVGLVAALNTKG